MIARLSVYLKRILVLYGLFDVCQIRYTTYVVGSKSFVTDQLFTVTEIKQLRYFST